MVLYLQKSCFLTPASNEVDGFALWPEPSEEELTLRKWELDDLLDQTHLTALVLALPLSAFSEEASLPLAINDLAGRLFSTSLDRGKLQRIFRKIGQNIFQTSTNDDQKSKFSKGVTEERLIHYISTRRVPSWQCEQLADRYPQLHRLLLQRLTWQQLHEIADRIPKAVRLRALIRDLQLEAARHDLGLPRSEGLSSSEEKILADLLESEDPIALDWDIAMNLGDNDIIIVRGEYACHGEGTYANARGNVVKLTPFFFSTLTNSWLEDHLVPNVTKVESIVRCSKYCTLIHELLHTESVLDIPDQKFSETAVKELEDALTDGREPPKRRLPRCVEDEDSSHKSCYGLADCMSRALLDRHHDTTYADENADNWAIYSSLYMLALQYPEFDFEDEVVKERKTLLHHFSAFDCLRHKEHGSIRDLPGYDKDQDLWYQAHGDEGPSDVKSLLEAVKDMAKKLAPSIEDILEDAGLLYQWDDALFGEGAYDFEIGGRWRTPLTARPRAS